MFKKQLGISIYPEHFSKKETIDYLNKCYKKGINNLFMSIIHFNKKEKDEILELYKYICVNANKIGFYIILDINDNALNLLELSINELNFFKKIGVSCVRLDSPLLPKEVADLTFNESDLDIQLNISNNDNFINNVLDYKPKRQNLFGCHNFYPLKNSGLSFNFFWKTTKRFVDLGIHSSAFVGSNFGNKGPQNYDVDNLVTIEKTRNLPIRSQAKFLFATGLISTVIVGNQAMSEEEIINFAEVNKIDKFEFDIKLDKNLLVIEKKILDYENHFWRGDLNEDFVRSTFTRVDFKDEIKTNNIKIKLNRGDVCIINKNNSHYQRELIIILKDNYTQLGNTANYIGSIKDYDLLLLSILQGWDKFKFRGV
ncbi:MupG family TIM beta-alpha barrel fold protein [Spiroplasma cantharicola]|uniref:Outer surface protein n=1 Tax=Spiroplasma cantharicola TaxID=362837 RepID=A0A0M4JWX8_9MOLU|nr:MupG family TIM beta-alpha barrel fold protein [Spiroplasma cantharicola]ALD66530.1 outer surface protein [Spiroplasma cantharicola]